MSLPLSPPPSRSSSQTSVSRKPSTYDPTTRFMPESPVTTPVSPSGGKAKPTLTLKPTTTPGTTLLASSGTLPSAAALQSFFSPCSDSDDSDSDSDSETNPTPIKSPRPRGHFQRLWASREAPSLPPSHPPPAVPRRLSIPNTPTFGFTTSPEKPQFQFSPGPNTPAHFAKRPTRLAMFAMHPPAAPEAPPTGVYPPPSPWSDAALSYVSSPTVATPTDPLLHGLQAMLAAQLQGLSGMLSAPAPAELAIARAERDRLVVKTQKAYFRRTPVEVVEEMQSELRQAEEKVRVLEKKFVDSFLGRLDGFVEGVRKGCMEFVKEEEPEVVEVDVEEDEDDEGGEEEEVFASVREWPEEEAVVEVQETEASAAARDLAAVNPERRFTWIPSSLDDEDEDEEEYYADETLPALSSDEEDTSSPLSSTYGSSPVIGCHRAECEVADCDCWNSFLPPSPALSSTSQRPIGKDKGVDETNAAVEWDMGWGENEVVVQQVGGIEMLMI